MLFAWRPIWTSRRARGASSPRLYVVRRIRKIPPFVAKQKVFGIPIPRAQKESASSLRSTRALRVDDDERSTPSQTKKRRCPTTIARAPLFFFVAVLFDYTSHFATTIPLSRFNKSSKRRGECVCVCVWISVKISPFATTLSFFTPTSRLEEAFEKRTGSLFCVFERTFSSTDLHVQCVDFSFFFTEYKNPKTKRHFFGRHFYVPAQKRQTQSRHDLKRRQLSRVSSANIIRNEENKKR